MYKPQYFGQFKRDFKRLEKQGLDMAKLEFVVNQLLDGKTLADKYKNHKLKGEFKGCNEIHIAPDWILVYHIIKQESIIEFVRMGSHADLFEL